MADPPIRDPNPYVAGFPNLGILYLAGALRRSMPDIRISYIDHRASWQDHVDHVARLRPAIYGLSFCSPLASTSFELIHAIKTACPQTRIVCGGPHPTVDPEGVLKCSPADCCCIGEGEGTLSELAHAVRRRDNLDGIRGLASRSPNGRVVFAPNRPLIHDLSDLAPPAWDMVDFRTYTGIRTSIAKPSTSIVASRGCPWNCSFCSNPVWRHQRPRVRLRPAASIAEEVRLLYDRGIREIYIRSDEMNVDLDWATDVFEHLAAQKLPGLYFQCNVRAKPMTTALADAMRRAGCWLCHIGIESSSERVLKGIRKGITLADVEDCTAKLKQANIAVYAFMMLYNCWEARGALQVETTREVLASLQYILRMRRRGRVDRISWGFATPYPGSELHRVSTVYNLQRLAPDTQGMLSPDRITMKLPGISSFTMVAARLAGLVTQGCLAAGSAEFWEWHNLHRALAHARFKAVNLLCGPN